MSRFDGRRMSRDIAARVVTFVNCYMAVADCTYVFFLLYVHQHIASFPAAQVPFHRGLRDPQVIILNPPAAAAEAPANHLIQAITGNRLALELNEIVAGMHAVLNCVANGNGVWERDLNQIRDLNFA